MVRSVHDDRLLLGQRGADRVGALLRSDQSTPGVSATREVLESRCRRANAGSGLPCRSAAPCCGCWRSARRASPSRARHAGRGNGSVRARHGTPARAPARSRTVAVRQPEALRALVRQADHGLVLGDVRGIRPAPPGALARVADWIGFIALSPVASFRGATRSRAWLACGLSGMKARPSKRSGLSLNVLQIVRALAAGRILTLRFPSPPALRRHRPVAVTAQHMPVPFCNRPASQRAGPLLQDASGDTGTHIALPGCP